MALNSYSTTSMNVNPDAGVLLFRSLEVASMKSYLVYQIRTINLANIALLITVIVLSNNINNQINAFNEQNVVATTNLNALNNQIALMSPLLNSSNFFINNYPVYFNNIESQINQSIKINNSLKTLVDQINPLIELGERVLSNLTIETHRGFCNRPFNPGVNNQYNLTWIANYTGNHFITFSGQANTCTNFQWYFEINGALIDSYWCDINQLDTFSTCVTYSYANEGDIFTIIQNSGGRCQEYQTQVVFDCMI
jgi:hypothetical protein